MSNGLPHLRKKVAKGRTYYYFDAGKDERGERILTKLPDIKDPRFGDCYARAKAERSKHKDNRGVLTMDGLIRSYEKSPEFRGLAESSRYNYSLYLSVANRFMRNKNGFSAPAESIRRSDIQALREKLADTPGAANSTMRALGALFAWAIDNEKVRGENPASKMKRFPAKPHEEWPEDLLEAALEDPQVGMAVALFYFTGQRINEVAKMSWGDIEGDYMRVFVQKKQNHLRVAILPELAERLSRLEKTAVTILTNSNGRPWSTTGLRQKLQLWAKERGFKVVPHGLRKNAVNALLEAGCTAAEVQGITDQSIPMIQHYAKGVNKLALGRAAVIKLGVHRKGKSNG